MHVNSDGSKNEIQRHSEWHGVGSFLVGLYVQTVKMFYKMALTKVN